MTPLDEAPREPVTRTVFGTTAHIEVVLPDRPWRDEPSMRKAVEDLVANMVGNFEHQVKTEYEGDIGQIEIKVKEGVGWQS